MKLVIKIGGAALDDKDLALAIRSNSSRSATAPVGLFGVATAIRRVAAVMFDTTIMLPGTSVRLHPVPISRTPDARTSKGLGRE